MRRHLPHALVVPFATLALVLGSTSGAGATPPQVGHTGAHHVPQSSEAVDPHATDTHAEADTGADLMAGTGFSERTSMAQDSAAQATATYPAATTFARPLKAKSYYVSSYFGGRCIVLPGASTMHLGVDLAAPGGSPIYAVAAGRVTHTVNGTSSVAGYITIEHRVGSQIYQSRYLHMWSATTHVRVGDIVKAGQQISVVGTSGGSTGNHLHFEWWKGPWGAATVQEPVAFLKSRSVDLIADAISVSATPTPATCTYYTTTGVNFRTGPSTSSTVIRLLPQGTQMTHVPGQITSGFIPVRIGGVSGWVSSLYVTPTRPAVVPAPPSPTPTPTPSPAPSSTSPGPYVAIVRVALKASPSVDAPRVGVVANGSTVGMVVSRTGDWRKFTHRGVTGWMLAKNVVPVPQRAVVRVALRSTPSVDAPRAGLAGKGAVLGTVLAANGDWRKFTYKGTTGWTLVKNVQAESLPWPPR